jgi:hypothetical protein
VSYILDALKKSEADRDPDTRASLAFEQREHRRQRLLTYVVLAALLANALILVWVFMPERWRPAPAATPATTGQKSLQDSPTATPPAPNAGRDIEPPPPGTPAPAAVPAIPAHANAATAARATVPGVSAAPGETVIGPDAAAVAVAAAPQRLADLPPDVRRRFPELNFSTHVYADEPDLRAIVVNGTRLMEGDRIGNVTVREITEDGAVFAFEGRLVVVPVLENWN